MTIFSWGGDIQLYDTLQSVKFFVADTFYLQCLIYLGTLGASVLMCFKFGFDPIKTAIKNLLFSTIIIQLFLVPSKQDVLIEDVVKNSTQNVSNIPIGYAYLLSFLSNAEYYFTETVEGAFSTPNSLKINQTGLGFGMTTHLKMMDAMTINDDLLETFGLYYYNCLRPELYMKNKTTEEIIKSDDILTTLEPTVAFETLTYTNGVSTQVSCEEAMAWLKPKIDIEAYKYLQNDLSAQLGMNSSKIEGAVGDMNGVLYGVSKTAKDTLTQAMARNLLNHGEIESAKLIGADVATATYTEVQARQQTRNSWNVAGKQAVENIPLMRIVYYNLGIGLLLFLSIFSAVSAQYKWVGLGIGLFLSISLWNPIGALINSQYYSEMEHFISSLAYLGDFITIQKMDLISEKTSTMLSMMSNLYTYIPLIAMALVTGSFAGLNAMASTSGANTNSIGTEATKGNIDAGHTRIGNATIGAIDVVTKDGHYGNKETGITQLASQRGTDNGLTYTQKEMNDTNGTISSTSAVGDVTASNNGLTNVKSHLANSKIEDTISNASEHVNSTSNTASKQISNNLIDQIQNTHGTNTVQTISDITGTNRETAETIESSRVKSEKAMNETLSTEEKGQLIKQAELQAGIKFNSGEEALGFIAKAVSGVSVGAGAGISLQDVHGNSKTIGLSEQTAEKLQNSYKSSFADSLKSNHQVMDNLATSVTNGTTHLNSSTVESVNSYQQAVKEDNTYKEAIQQAKSRGYDITTQVVEQAVKLQNPNFENYTPQEKINLTQGYLYDISQGDKSALNTFKNAENMVISKYASDTPVNNIQTPSNDVTHHNNGANVTPPVQNNNFEQPQPPVSNNNVHSNNVNTNDVHNPHNQPSSEHTFKVDDKLTVDEKQFSSTSHKIDGAKYTIMQDSKSDILPRQINNEINNVLSQIGTPDNFNATPPVNNIQTPSNDVTHHNNGANVTPPVQNNNFEQPQPPVSNNNVHSNNVNTNDVHNPHNQPSSEHTFKVDDKLTVDEKQFSSTSHKIDGAKYTIMQDSKSDILPRQINNEINNVLSQIGTPDNFNATPPVNNIQTPSNDVTHHNNGANVTPPVQNNNFEQPQPPVSNNNVHSNNVNTNDVHNPIDKEAVQYFSENANTPPPTQHPSTDLKNLRNDLEDLHDMVEKKNINTTTLKGNEK